MKHWTWIAALILAGATPAAADYLVREVGSFHVGGRQETLAGLATQDLIFTPGAPPVRSDPNGEFETGQMYVHYVRLSRPRGSVPLLFWHGGGLTGVTWETKPDGAPGWQHFFLHAGYDTFVSDAVERGRASWSRYPEIYRSAPFFRAKREGWELFRLGPSYQPGGRREAFAGVRFPIDAYDQFAKQFVPRWVTNDAATQAAYDALVQKVCPCVIVAHSQGANFAFTAALTAPDKVKALVVVEPSAAPDPAMIDLARLKSVPHLAVWGDNMPAVPVWGRLVQAPNRYLSALRAVGGKVEVLDLPAIGIRGNSHMLMMDDNSDAIAGRIQHWLASQGL